MPISLFEFLLAPFARKTSSKPENLSFLTHQEIRELLRMRAEVQLAREQVKLQVSHTRIGAL